MTQIDKTALRDAATVIVMRDSHVRPRILMGQRGATAAFLPNKYVFPGGAVDPVDGSIDLSLNPDVAAKLSEDSARPAPALAAAAIRELWEETGQILGRRGAWDDAPQEWRGFARSGHVPNAADLDFVFRAVTPAGRPRRFDARFFCVNADYLASDPDDFSRAEDELSHLHWVPLDEVRALDLPFITEVVLAEVSARVHGTAPTTVPFFRNDDEAHLVTRLGGQSPLGQ